MRRRMKFASLAVLLSATASFAQVATWNGSNGAWDSENWIWEPSQTGFPDSPSESAVISSGFVTLGDGLTFSIGSFTLGGSGQTGGTGTVIVNGTFTQTAGVLGGDFILNGSGNWSGGNWNSPGTTTIGTSGSLTISGAENNLASHNLTNNGTVTHTGGAVRGGSTTITNNGLWLSAVAFNTEMNGDFGGGMSFNNAAGGTFRKTTGTLFTTTGNVNFNNAGLVDVQDGVLTVNAGAATTGAEFRTSGSGVINLTNYELSGSILFAGDGNRHNAGIISGTHSISGTLNFTGGNFNSTGTTTVASDGQLVLAAAENDIAGGRVLINNGTVTHTNGSVRSGGGSSWQNNGLWVDSASSNTGYNADFGGAAVLFNTATGIFRKTSGVLTTFSSNLPFDNAGLVDNQSGILSFNAGTGSSGAEFRTTGTAVTNLNNYTLSGTVLFTGTGNQHAADTLSGTHTLRGQFSLVGGTFNSAGVSTIASDGNLVLAAGANDFAGGRMVVNQGTVSHVSGSVRGGGAGTTFTNEGVWLDSASSNTDYNGDYGGSIPEFNNTAAGVFRKTTGLTTTLQPSFLFNNAGLVDNLSGVLNINAGTATGGSEFRAAAGAVTNINNYTLSGNVTFTGEGENRHASGTLSGNGTIFGTLYWTGGDLAGVATTTIAPSAQLVISDGDADFHAGRTIVNNGTITRIGGSLRGGGAGNSLLVNNALFVDNVSHNSEINSDYGGGVQNFNNVVGGTFRKTSPTLTTISAQFNNAGLVDNQNGTLVIAAGTGLNDAVFNTASGASTLFSNYTFTGHNTFTGVGVNRLNGGAISGTHNVSGLLQWGNASLSTEGVTTVNADGTLQIVSEANFPGGRTIVNNGTLDRAGGSLRGGGALGSIFQNNALFLDNTNFNSEINSDWQGAGLTFNNNASGTFRKVSSTLTTVSAAFNNYGLVDNQSGLLQIFAGAGQEGGVFHAAASAVTRFGNYAFDGNVTFNGAGTNILNSGAIFGTFSISGLLQWGGASLGTPGTATINPGATLQIVSEANYPGGRTLINNGTILRTGGSLRGGGTGSNLRNNALFLDDTNFNSEINSDFQGAGQTFNNNPTGVFRKTSPTLTTISATFVNEGLVDVQNGLLSIVGSYIQTAGRTQVNGGTITGSSTLNITGGEVGGSGTISSPLNLSGGGSLAPGLDGENAGLLNLASVTMDSASGYEVNLLGPTRGTEYDAVNVSNTITLGGTLDVVVGADFEIGMVFNILDRPGSTPLAGTFNGLAEGDTFVAGRLELQISYLGGTGGNDVTLTVTQVVPEPASLVLGLLAVPMLVGRRRRQY